MFFFYLYEVWNIKYFFYVLVSQILIDSSVLEDLQNAEEIWKNNCPKNYCAFSLFKLKKNLEIF